MFGAHGQKWGRKGKHFLKVYKWSSMFFSPRTPYLWRDPLDFTKQNKCGQKKKKNPE